MEADYQEKYTSQQPSHTHLSPLEWLNPGLKHSRRPYTIAKDVSSLEESKPVTKILRRGSFRTKLEDIFRDITGGSNPAALRRLQDNVVPASRIEKAMKQNQQILSTQHATSPPGTHVIPVNDLTGINKDKYMLSERLARCKLASLYRVIERMGWTHEIYNHISLRAPGNEEHFLINAFGLHYSEVTASNLVKVNLHGDVIDPGSTQLGINRAGYVIHSTIHEAREDIKCIIHIHTPHGAGVSAMMCGLLPLCQEALVIGGVSYHAYRGIACNEAEKVELAKDLGSVNKVMILHNHGLLAMGSTVEEAYHVCVNLMAACETQVMSLSAGLSNLMLVSNEIANKVVRTVNRSGGGVSRHGNLEVGQLEYEAMMRVLDNLGYNTGYPYKNMELLTPPLESGEPPPADHSLDESLDESPQMRVSRRSSSNDLESVVKQIKLQMRRIKGEREGLGKKTPKAIELENESETDQRNWGSNMNLDLKAIASNSEGTTRPVSTGHTPLIIPGITSLAERENPSLGHMTYDSTHGAPVLQPPLYSQHHLSSETGPGTPIDVPAKYNTQQREEVQPVSSSATVGENHFNGRPESKKGIWDFLDKRQSQGLLPISTDSHCDQVPGKKPYKSTNYQPMQEQQQPISAVASPILTQGISQTENNQYPLAGDLAHTGPAQSANLMASTHEHDWQRSEVGVSGSSPTNSHMSFQSFPLSQSKQYTPLTSSPQPSPQLLTHAQYHPNSLAHPTSHPQGSQPDALPCPNKHTVTLPQTHIQTHPQPHPQPRPQPLLQPHTRSEFHSYAPTHPPSHSQFHPQTDVQPHPLSLVHSQTGVQPNTPARTSLHYPPYNHSHQKQSNGSALDGNPESQMSFSVLDTTTPLENSNPSAYVSLGDPLLSSHPTTRESSLPSFCAVRESSSTQPNKLGDLRILSKLEETAKAVADSTGEAVERLATYKEQQQKHNEASGQSRTQGKLGNGPTVQKGNDRNGLSQANSNSVTPTKAVNGIKPAGYTSSEQIMSNKGAPDESSSVAQSNGPTKAPPIFLYSPPQLDERLTGLNKTLNTAKMVAESTGMSVEKLNKSLSIHGPQTDSDHQTSTDDDSV